MGWRVGGGPTTGQAGQGANLAFPRAHAAHGCWERGGSPSQAPNPTPCTAPAVIVQEVTELGARLEAWAHEAAGAGEQVVQARPSSLWMVHPASRCPETLLTVIRILAKTACSPAVWVPGM